MRWSGVVVSITFIFAKEVDDRLSHPWYLLIQSPSVQLLLMLRLYEAVSSESFLANRKESVQAAYKYHF